MKTLNYDKRSEIMQSINPLKIKESKLYNQLFQLCSFNNEKPSDINYLFLLISLPLLAQKHLSK